MDEKLQGMYSSSMQPHFYERLRCRLCNEPRADGQKAVLKLPSTPLANSFCKMHEEALQLPQFQLKIYSCARCGHHQLGHVVSPDAMFSDYAYASGTSESFRKHFDNYAAEIHRRYPSAKRFLEVGSNDGTMLKALMTTGDSDTTVIGVEPATNLVNRCHLDGLNVLHAFFGSHLLQRPDMRNIDFWTANNVLAHVDHFVPTLDALEKTGARAGVFEVQYLGAMLEHGHVDNCYHEHLDYWRCQELFEHLHLHTQWYVTDVQQVPTHGGSLRVWVERAGVKGIPDRSEDAAALAYNESHKDWPLAWAALQLKMESERKRLWALLGDGKRVAVFGAPAKLTTLLYGLQLTGLEFSYVVDDSPLKQGLFTPGMGLEVCSAERLQSQKPDVVLVGAWNFAAHIVPRVKAMCPDVKVVVPFEK